MGQLHSGTRRGRDSLVAGFGCETDESRQRGWLARPASPDLPAQDGDRYQIERDMGEALLKKDAAAWDRILASEFQRNYASFVGNKKQFLAVMKSDTARFESAVNSKMKAFVFGDTAIVHGLSTTKSSMGGKDTSGQDRFTDVFVKRDGRWQCVTGYSVKVQ